LAKALGNKFAKVEKANMNEESVPKAIKNPVHSKISPK
jgi:hypothetical protein